MGRTNENIIGVTKINKKFTKVEIERISELLQCMDIAGVETDPYFNEYVINEYYYPKIGGNKKEEVDYDFKKMHSVINTLFPETCLFVGDYRCDTIADNYEVSELILDPVNGRETNYLKDEIAGIDDYSFIYKEIEEAAKKKGIEPEWEYDDNDEMYPSYDNEEFYDFAEKYKNKYDEKHNSNKSKKYKVAKIDKKYVDSIKAKAEANSFNQLLKLLNNIG